MPPLKTPLGNILMQLKRIEITGFKSFGKKTTLIFDTPVTAIVGPNGSGKSNIAEALRWVLGEQSMKSLRGKRGEDLIFNGAAGGARLSRAGVTLVFDNTKRQIKLEYDEVVIAREVYRDGVNKYSINNSEVRLRDIVEALSAVSLGPSGHHIISQGEADKVLNAGSKERREILEEALGLKIFQFKITESNKRLVKTEDNLKQVESLRREIAPHLKFLKKQVEEAEKIVVIRQELASLAKGYFTVEGVYLDGLKGDLQNDKHKLTAELSVINHDLVSARRELETADSSSKGKDPRVTELEQEIKTIRDHKDATARELGRVEGKLDEKKHVSIVRYNKVTGEEVCRYCGQVIVRKVEAREMEEDTGNLESEKMSLESKLRELANKEKGLVDELDRLRVSLSTKSEQARQAERRLYEFKSREQVLQVELDKVSLRESAYKNEHEVYARDAHEISMLVGDNILSTATWGPGPQVTREEQQQLRKKIERLKIKIEDAGGVGVDVIKEHEETSKRDLYLTKEIEDLTSSIASIKDILVDLTTTLDVRLKEGLVLVNSEFEKFFNTLFGGGEASVKVISLYKPRQEVVGDEIVEIEEDEKDKEKDWGIDIKVNLPRKKIKGLEMLSGGERALTSIALLFAMSQVNPPPFLVLDETDAALDEANSKKYGDMLTELSTKSQLIVVTHNRETMSHAQVIYGVTMGADGLSRLLSIRFEDATTFAK